MYIGDMDNYGAMYYDGKCNMKFHMRGMWHTYKTIDDNEILMHLKGMYVYSFAWPDIWKIWSKGQEDAASVIRAAKRDVDSHAGHAGAQEICNVFLWVKNIRKGITEDFVDYYPWSEN